MKDYIESELNRNLIFKNEKYAYGVVIKKPFAMNFQDIQFKFIQLTSNDDLTVTISPLDEKDTWESFVIAETNEEYIGVGASTKRFLTNEKEISLHTDDYYIRYANFVNKIDENSIITCSVSFNRAGENNTVEAVTYNDLSFTLDNALYGQRDFIIGTDDNIEVRKSLWAQDKVYHVEKQEDMLMTILFTNSYDIPVVRVYNDTEEKTIEDAINAMDIMYLKADNIRDYLNSINAKCILDLTCNDVTEERNTVINHKNKEMHQERNLDNTIRFNFFDNMYKGNESIKDTLIIESFDIEEENSGNLLTKNYRNYNTGISFKKIDIADEYPYEWYHNSVLIDEGKTSSEKIYEGVKLLPIASKSSISYRVLTGNEKDKVSGKLLNKYLATKTKEEFEEATKQGLIEKVVSMIIFEPANSNNCPYNRYIYADASNVQFNYMYDKNADVYMYTDPICNIVFKVLEDHSILPIRAEMVGDIIPVRIYIRDLYGVPHFFKNPSLTD
jgi:hypothetical protein